LAAHGVHRLEIFDETAAICLQSAPQIIIRRETKDSGRELVWSVCDQEVLTVLKAHPFGCDGSRHDG
jgi:hypothetical protein